MELCLCLRQDGLQCQRPPSTKRGDDPRFCWQHQKCKRIGKAQIKSDFRQSTLPNRPQSGWSTLPNSPQPEPSTVPHSPKSGWSTFPNSPKFGPSTVPNSPKPATSTLPHSPKSEWSTFPNSPQPATSTVPHSPKSGWSTLPHSPQSEKSIVPKFSSLNTTKSQLLLKSKLATLLRPDLTQKDPRSLTILSGPHQFTFYPNIHSRKILLLGETHGTNEICPDYLCPDDEKKSNCQVYEVHEWLHDLSEKIPEDQCLDIFLESSYRIRLDQSGGKPLKNYSH